MQTLSEMVNGATDGGADMHPCARNTREVVCETTMAMIECKVGSWRTRMSKDLVYDVFYVKMISFS